MLLLLLVILILKGFRKLLILFLGDLLENLDKNILLILLLLSLNLIVLLLLKIKFPSLIKNILMDFMLILIILLIIFKILQNILVKLARPAIVEYRIIFLILKTLHFGTKNQIRTIRFLLLFL